MASTCRIQCHLQFTAYHLNKLACKSGCKSHYSNWKAMTFLATNWEKWKIATRSCLSSQLPYSEEINLSFLSLGKPDLIIIKFLKIFAKNIAVKVLAHCTNFLQLQQFINSLINGNFQPVFVKNGFSCIVLGRLLYSKAIAWFNTDVYMALQCV